MFNLSFSPKAEFASPKKIRALQGRLLRRHIFYCLYNSRFYRSRLKKNSFNDNLSDLPFTEKEDIAKHNDDFLAVPNCKIADIVLSSGTTSKPTRIAYTGSDLLRLAYNEKQSFLACGMTKEDRVLLTCTLDRCFVAGLAYFLGVRSVGASVIRNGVNSLESHFEVIKLMHPSVIIGVPSFLRKLGEYLKEQGLLAEKSKINKLICIGEPLRDKNLRLLRLGKDLEKIWKAKVYSTYSSSEIVSTFCECSFQNGGHLHPDLAIVEIVDEDGRTLRPGCIGEVVVTPLQVEGMPLIRFKTGDISFIIDKPCLCGRYSIRLGPILGRKKQMMKVKGTTFYPQAVFSCLEEINQVSEYYISVSSKDRLSDNVEVYVSVKGSFPAKAVEEKLSARLRIRPRVVIVKEEAIRKQVYNSSSRKPVRFFDGR